jgi:cardiolipin synthase
MPWTSATFYHSLLQSGVRIFEYLPSMLHAKALILDDWVTIGSSNLNHRSLLHDLEIDVNIRLSESKKIIINQFMADLQNSKEVFLDYWQDRPYYQRIFGRLLLYVKYWI